MTKKIFMIAAIASVVIVRDGKRKVISASSGDYFTEEEIASVNGSLPGALRRPLNESTAAQIAEESEDAGEPAPAKTAPKGKAKAETAAQKKKREAAEAKAAADAADEGDEDEDEDEDEDI